MSSLTGKVAIVTASSRGIGRSLAKPLGTRIALRLGRDGAAVAVNYIASPEKAEAVVKEIIANGGKAIAIQGSVANKADVTRLFDETEKQLGSITSGRLRQRYRRECGRRGRLQAPYGIN